MNPHIEQLLPYPFERLNALKSGITPDPAYPAVMLSIGEPKHPPPDFVVSLLTNADRLRTDLAAYPATRGSDDLRRAIAGWLQRRFGVSADPETQILPVSGTREALFSFAQATLSGYPGSLAVLPNPFYQIYEGAALLRGANIHFVNCGPETDYQPDYRAVPSAVWERCELLTICSPGNPTGRTLPLQELTWLIDQADRYDFIIAADECYSEIYSDEAAPPAGLLEAAAQTGRHAYQRCVVFHSLSKRSNLPGLRSGFVAGDARVLADYFKYRTYHGCAMPNHVQAASAAAWDDEEHVIANRAEYRRKFASVTRVLHDVLPLNTPQGGFYHWVATPEDDQIFAQQLFAARNITVLPGSFLARESQGRNPGRNHVRIAWVAPAEQCVAAAEQIASWMRRR
jgi:N-succinyldiaminopimelate aminotransferase